MALGKLSSLGVGSNVLNYDTIDKLKKADEESMIKPVDKKIETGMERQIALAEVMAQLKTLKNETKSLSDYSSYLARKSSVSGDGVKASVGAGVPVQDISVEVDKVAKSDINEIGTKFESRESVFSQKNTQIKFFVNNKEYKINIKGGTTLGEVAQLITDKTGGDAMGIIMKTGGPRPFSLMINSKNTGTDQEVLFGSTISSGRILGGTLSIGGVDEKGNPKDDFSITLKDKNGVDKTINITLNQTNTDFSAAQNAALLKESIENALKKDPDFSIQGDPNDPNSQSQIIDSIKIKLDSTGEKLLINDISGGDIKIGGSKAGGLGFKKEDGSKSEPIIKASKGVSAGLLSGNLTVNGESLDLASISSEEATALDNANAIANALNGKNGLEVKVNKDGILEIDSKNGEVNIMSINQPTLEEVEAEKEALEDGIEINKDEKSKKMAEKSKNTLESLGLEGGTTIGYAKTYSDILKVKKIQTSDDASFTYNGMQITRPTNVVDDVISGVSLELVAPTEDGKPAIVDISRDTESLKENIKKFVEVYNEISLKLEELTKYDEDSKVAGIFNGVSDIRMIKPSLSRIFSQSIMIKGDNFNLIRYGLSIDESGKMILDESKLAQELISNPDGAQEFFDGYTAKSGFKETEIDGIFTLFDKELESLVGGTNSRLKTYEEELTRDDKKLREDRKKAMEHLNTRYDLMAQRFAAYDGQIAKTNNSFNSVQMLIDQAAAKK